MTTAEKLEPIDKLELLAIYESILRWRAKLTGMNVLIWCDNQVVVSCYNIGRPIPRLQLLMEKILLLERSLRGSFRCAYIPTDQNKQADHASRHNRVCSAPNYIVDRNIYV